MAVRSTAITIENYTGTSWERSKEHLEHGIWTEDHLPPEHFPAVKLDDEGDVVAGTIYFQGESEGFATGVEGEVIYDSDLGQLRIYFNNPFIGANEFSVTGPDRYKYEWGDISGNNANVIAAIKKKS